MNTRGDEMDTDITVREREFSPQEQALSVCLANIHAVVPDQEVNRCKILKVVEICKEKHINVVIFPEFCFSGYFWNDYKVCKAYMDSAVIEENGEWIMHNLYPLLDDELVLIVLNNIRRAPGEKMEKYYNSTFLLNKKIDFRNEDYIYNKIMLPGIEKQYTVSGCDDRLVVDTRIGRFGFTTCYDYCFSELLREYAQIDNVDAVIQVASWRGTGDREYREMNIQTDMYYGYLWDLFMASRSATNQFWTLACNAVGTHEISGARFWGGSGIWAPSGINLISASHYNEELLIVRNIDIKGQRRVEREDFDYSIDFNQIYRYVEDTRTFTRL